MDNFLYKIFTSDFFTSLVKFVAIIGMLFFMTFVFLWNNFFAVLIGVAITALVIFYVGERLVFYAGRLSESTGLSGAWIGFLIVAIITSIPEIVSTFTAVTHGQLGLATGGIFGSSAANISILAFVFLILRKQKIILSQASFFAMIASLIMLTLVSFIIFFHKTYDVLLNKWMVAAVIFLVYCLLMYISFSLDPDDNQKTGVELKNTLLNFVFYSISLIFLSWILVILCEQLSRIKLPYLGYTLGAHFVGTLILAVATSVPELVTAFQMVKKNMNDMALGNIFGSNVFNLMVFGAASLAGDYFFWQGVPFDVIYTIFTIYAVSLITAVLNFMKKGWVVYSIYVLVLILWIGSLLFVF
ncbi:cation:H+ antiporter [Brevinema andersonii]|uniref:Cation:H+ antiporter n=1 Tax=Brevinema andersonii TaxID=34097 RepID=A0A1I1DAV0_BREAD|nr:hypothetical protein [Brevinema andersonii]SFB71947.1 cation:H+ antiporter [Brevinema andersonii]